MSLVKENETKPNQKKKKKKIRKEGLESGVGRGMA